VRRRRTTLICAFVLALLALPSAAQADFGLVPGKTTITPLNKDGTIDTQAGSHPYSFTVHFELNRGEDGTTEGGEMRDVFVK
jgi:P pilus assembly chaperone PapD